MNRQSPRNAKIKRVEVLTIPRSNGIPRTVPIDLGNEISYSPTQFIPVEAVPSKITRFQSTHRQLQNVFIGETSGSSSAGESPVIKVTKLVSALEQNFCSLENNYDNALLKLEEVSRAHRDCDHNLDQLKRQLTKYSDTDENLQRMLLENKGLETQINLLNNLIEHMELNAVETAREFALRTQVNTLPFFSQTCLPQAAYFSRTFKTSWLQIR